MHLHNGTYRIWVTDRLSRRRRVSTETPNAVTAAKVEAWVKEVHSRLDQLGVLAAIVRGDLTLAEAFSLGEVDAARWLIAKTDAAADSAVTDAVLDEWVRFITTQGRDAVKPKTAALYRLHVETLWPEPRVVSWLTPQHITAALDALEVKAQTKARYRASLSSLCSYLVRRHLLQVNPMTSVASFPQSPARVVEMTRVDALRLLEALPVPQRALEGVMWACGWEWSAIANAKVGDFDLDAKTSLARGTKTATRHRLTVFTEPEPLAWMLAHLAGRKATEPAFPDIDPTKAIRAHQAACKALELPVTTLHDWRHVFAVKEIKKGRPLQFVAQMLGHANTTQVQTRYGLHTLGKDEVALYAAACPPDGPQPAPEPRPAAERTPQLVG